MLPANCLVNVAKLNELASDRNRIDLKGMKDSTFPEELPSHYL